MRHILLVVAMFIAPPLGVRAQQQAPLASLDEPCSVSADPRWTNQEKFVWERVCVGEVANFNTAPGYGGKLDPKMPDGWPQNRVLRPVFLETILLKDPYRRALHRGGVVIFGAVSLENAELDHPFGLGDSLLEKDLNLAWLRSKFPIRFQGGKVSGMLDLHGLQVGSNLFMNKNEFANVNLLIASVSGQLILSGSKVTGMLNMDGLKVGSLHMDEAEFADVILVAAQVRGNLHLSRSKIGGDLECYALEVEQMILMADAKFDGRIECAWAKIKGGLMMSAQFKKDVDWGEAEIGGALGLYSAQWADGTTLVLRNAKVGIMPALADNWAPNLELDGLTYRSIGAADQFQNWFDRLDRHLPQPYDQLASIVESQGNGTLATAIRYSGRERERDEATGIEWVWLTALKWVIGYGYYPQRAIFWAIGLVLMGAIVLRVSREGPRNGMPFGLAYSFDTLLPIIKLRDRHYQIDLKTWARYYFYGHKIMGYVLAAFLAAGLSGLTK